MKKQVLILGDIFLDIFEVTKVLKISPESPIAILKPIKTNALLGGAANVANNIKSIGGFPFIISKFGNGTNLQKIKNLLKKNQIQFKIISSKNYSSIIKKRIVENHHQFCRIDNESMEILSKVHETEIIKFIKKNINKFESLILSDYSKGFLTPNLIKKTIDIFKKNKKLIFTDPKNKNINIYKGSNFICPNLKEYKEFFDYEKLEMNNQSVSKLFKKSQSDAFIVTKGSDGISVIYKNTKQINIPQKSVNVYDVTGAGDTFIGFFSYLISNNIDLINSLKISSYACIRVVQKKYTATLNFKEFQEIIDEFCKKEVLDFNLKIKLWKLVKFKIGATNGCFDILHPGHLHLFNQAKKYCDKLIVLINSDKSVKKLKGNNRPKLKLLKRINFLKMIRDIDDITFFEEETPKKILTKILPDVLFKGSDYKKNEVVGYKLIKKNGGTVKIINKLKDFSTSKLINN
jgi:D-beta-D-heptose 7-phosphate kinase / D-beta-D-heptose 1-phosphate adenosyltransferase